MGRLEQRRLMRSLEILVPITGLSYFASFASFLILRGLTSTGTLAPYQVFFIPLATACTLSAVGIWYKPSLGYTGAASISIILIMIFFLTRDGNDVVTVLSNPARNFLQFVFYLTTVPTFFSTFISSIVWFRRVRRRPAGGSGPKY